MNKSNDKKCSNCLKEDGETVSVSQKVLHLASQNGFTPSNVSNLQDNANICYSCLIKIEEHISNSPASQKRQKSRKIMAIISLFGASLIVLGLVLLFTAYKLNALSLFPISILLLFIAIQMEKKSDKRFNSFLENPTNKDLGINPTNNDLEINPTNNDLEINPTNNDLGINVTNKQWLEIIEEGDINSVIAKIKLENSFNENTDFGSPLTIAANLGNTRIMELLLKAGAEPILKEAPFGPPLFESGVLNVHLLKEDVITMLKEYGSKQISSDEFVNTNNEQSNINNNLEKVENLEESIQPEQEKSMESSDILPSIDEQQKQQMTTMQRLEEFDNVEMEQISSLSNSILKHLCKMQQENPKAKFACEMIEILKDETLRTLMSCMSMRYVKGNLYGQSFEDAPIEHHQNMIEAGTIKTIITNAALPPYQEENQLFPSGYLTTFSQELEKRAGLKIGDGHFAHFTILVGSTGFKVHASVFPAQTVVPENIPVLALDLLLPNEHETLNKTMS